MLAEEPDIELLLLDINMPVMDGLTLLSELRERQSPVRAIIVSAYGDMTNIRTAMNRGAFDFVTKPVDLNDLEVTIRKTLDDIAELRETRPSARRRRAGAHQPVPLFLAEPGRDAGRPRRAAGRGAAADRGRAVRRYRRLHPHGRDHAARSGRRPAARVPRADDGADLRLRRHRREIYRRRDLRGVRAAEAEARTTLPTRCAVPTACWRRSTPGMPSAPDTASRRSRSASASITGQRCIGDVGSEHSLSFTVIGDTVNTASRLQALTRSLGTPLVVADAVISNIAAAPPSDATTLLAGLTDQGEQVLRGRGGAVRVWTRA